MFGRVNRVRFFATLCPVAVQAPLSAVFSRQEGEGVAMPSFRGSSRPRDQTRVSCIAGEVFTAKPPGKPVNILGAYHWCLANVTKLTLRDE